MAYINAPQENRRVLRNTKIPPGRSDEPYVVSAQEGEVIYIPLSKSATRLLVTGKETEDAFAVVGSSGSQNDLIGFHYHHEAHDVFICLKGKINVWVGEKCRTMEPGDFASVSPGTVHQYQILGSHSEMIGLIVPGGWEEFFRFIGEPYAGPHWPLQDDRNFFEVLLPKLEAAAMQFDMVPCPHLKQTDPSPWQADENVLPGTYQPYFLKSGSGPSYLAGGLLYRPLITTVESNGKFAIGSIEGSSHHIESDLFANGRRMTFATTHHAFQIIEGAVQFHVGDSSPVLLHAGELIYVPSGTRWGMFIHSRYAKLYAFANGRGITELLVTAGQSYNAPIPPEKADQIDMEDVRRFQSAFGYRVY